MSFHDANDRADQLLAMTERLVSLIREEIAAVKNRTLNGASAGWDDDVESWSYGGGPGLIGILVFFAGVALLFMNRYPLGIFGFVLGLDRWVARVAAYAALMTDQYPPFRLDQGGEEPAASLDPTAGGAGADPA